nr:sensor histidine kinase [Bacillota bacterium]
PITFILYLLIYLNTVYIKYLYHTGFRKGLIDSSFIGKALLFLVRGIREISKRLMTVDLREDNQRRLIGIAVMNFLVIVILGSGGFLGIVLAVIYSVVVFKYILGLIESASELNLASEQVSAGNFDIKVDEDMGVLTPMAKNLNNIKQGFSVAVDKKIRSERMKSELISNVSHDLKTPLTSIITYVDLLKNEDVEPNTQKEYIDIIDKKSQRLKILIEDLFEASKATSGNIDFNLEDIDVVALLRQTLGELEEKINESNLQFRINAPENKVMCNLDGRRTYRVFANIISNILKYSMENSRVYIDIIESEHEVSFTFKNISACEMNFDPSDITERFTRGDESRSTDGAGLGLSIAKSLVELQGGTLDIIIDGDLFKLVVTFSKA